MRTCFAMCGVLLGLALVAHGGQEVQSGAGISGQTFERLLDLLPGALPGPGDPEKTLDCDDFVGDITPGTPVYHVLGDCYYQGYYFDFWRLSATAGIRLTVTFASTPPLLVTIQDYASGDILASSADACGGSLCTGASFSYTPLSSGTYVIGVAAAWAGAYSLSVTAAAGGGANLTPYRPSGWSDAIVVSTVAGTHTDASSIGTSDTLRVDYAVVNSGTGGTGTGFSNQLLLDGALVWTGNANPLAAGYYTSGNDVVVGPLPAGAHTLRVRADAANAVAETNEGDNEYTRTFTVSGGGGSCQADADTVCLQGGRFKVEVMWQDFSGGTGWAQRAEVTSPDSALLWFFSAQNWEMLVKVLDGCGVNGHYWFFSAATTNVGYRITVTDTARSLTRTYDNAAGTLAPATGDTAAFVCQ